MSHLRQAKCDTLNDVNDESGNQSRSARLHPLFENVVPLQAPHFTNLPVRVQRNPGSIEPCDLFFGHRPTLPFF